MQKILKRTYSVAELKIYIFDLENLLYPPILILTPNSGNIILNPSRKFFHNLFLFTFILISLLMFDLY